MGKIYLKDIREDLREELRDNRDCRNCGWMCCGGWTIFFIIFIACSLGKVASTEYGLKYNRLSCTLGEEVLSEGLHTHPPFGTILIWPKIYKTIEFTNSRAEDTSGGGLIRCISKDGVRITADASFQFVAKKDKLYDLTLKYQDFETFETIVVNQARSTLRHSCGAFTAQEYQTDRARVRANFEDLLADSMDKLGAQVFDLQLRNIDRPVKYEVAVEDKESARADITLAGNERRQALVKAETLLAESKLKANQTMDKANTDAAVTKARATAEAESALNKYEELARIYGGAKTTHNLNDAGIMTYVANTIHSSSEASKVQMPHTAQVDYKEDL